MKLSAIVDGEMLKCRPPRGGRGLKLDIDLFVKADGVVAPLAGGVD